MLKSKLLLYKKYLLEISKFVFQVFLTTYLVFLFIEYLYFGFITEFFNLNIILNTCLFSGIIIILISKKGEENKKLNKISQKEYLTIIGIAIISFIFIFIRIKEIGWISYILSLVSAIIIFLTLIWPVKDKGLNTK